MPLRLFACATALVLVAAEPAAQEGTRAAGCEARRQSCAAACRARHFSIDPKRDACVAACAAEANRCLREQAARPAARDYGALAP